MIRYAKHTVEPIGFFTKKNNKKITVRAHLTIYKEKPFADIREYFDGTPTRKGIRIDFEQWDEFMDLMSQINEKRP